MYHRRVLSVTAIVALPFGAPLAHAQDDDPPVQMSVTVVPPDGTTGPPPTGDVVVSLDGRKVLSIALSSSISAVTTITPLVSGAVSLLGRKVTISYSGDSNYEASDGVTVTFSTRDGLKLVARPRDTAAPTIDVASPGDGVRYEPREQVLAIYSCADPGDRSLVTRCEGTVASGDAIDTSSAGRRAFVVRSTDAVGNDASRTVTYEVAVAVATLAAPPAPATPGGAPPAPPPPTTPDAAAAFATARIPARLPAGAPPAGTPSRPRAGAPRAPGAAPPPAGPRDADAPQRAAQQYASYDPRSEPVKTIGILVAAFTLLQISLRSGGLALAGGGGGVLSSRARGQVRRGRRGRRGRDAPAPEASFDYESVDVEFLGAGLGAVALGDRSRTWGWPGTRRLDAWNAALPARLAHRTPLLARVLADGTYLRAILGSASLLTLLAGLTLGVLAVVDTGGDAVPPVAALTIAIAVLGVLDAAAGFGAVLIFSVGVLALGGVDSSAHLRLMLGLGALWFVVPVLAGAVRPLRREPARNLVQSWDRAADFVIASLIGAWAVQKIVLALPGLGGVRLPIAEHADLAALCVLAALVVRLLLETIAAHLYPRRLDVTEAGDLPQPSAIQRLGASALRTAIFLFFARIVVGDSWQLWLGAALFVTPQILAVFEERFPNSPKLYRALPKGLAELVLMLFVGTALGALLIRTMNENADTFLADSFVLLAVPGFLLSLLQLFARDGPEPPIGWGKRIGGLVLLVAGVLLVLGLLL